MANLLHNQEHIDQSYTRALYPFQPEHPRIAGPSLPLGETALRRNGLSLYIVLH